MARYNHPNFGDVQKHIPMKGTITSVNLSDDTADVTVPGGSDGTAIPIFYHCDPDSEERDNGAIEGAAAGFSKDDEVIVMCTIDGTPVRIVGFVDGIKKCGSSFLIFLTTIHDPDGVGQIMYTVWDVINEEVPEITYEDEPIELPIKLPLNDIVARRNSPFMKWVETLEYEALEEAIEFVPASEPVIAVSGSCVLYPDPFGPVYGIQHCFESGKSGNYGSDWSTDSYSNPPFLSRGMKNTYNDEWIGTANIIPRVNEIWQETEYETAQCYELKTVERNYTFYTPFGILCQVSTPYHLEAYSGPFDPDAGPFGACTGENAWSNGSSHVFLMSQVEEDRPKDTDSFIQCLRSTKNKEPGEAYGDFILHVYLTSFVIRDSANHDYSYTYTTEVYAGLTTFPDIDASEQNPLETSRHSGLEQALQDLFDAALNASENELPASDYEASVYRPKEIKNLVINLYKGSKDG